MKNSIAVHLRNLVIYLLVIIFATVGAEAILTNKQHKTTAAYEAQTQKIDTVTNLKYRHLMLEFSPIENILSTEMNASDFTGWLVDSAAEKNIDTYPLIKHLSASPLPLDKALNIVVIGDSFTWGAYHLNRNNVFWRLLENELRSNGIRANVYGVAETGANAYEELAWLSETSLVEDLKPDLVIFGYVYNDAEYVNKIDSVEMNVDSSIIPGFFAQRFPSISDRLLTKIKVGAMYSDKYSDNNSFVTVNSLPLLKGKFYETYKNEFCEKLNNYAKTADFPICVMTLPSLPDNDMTNSLFKPLKKLYSQYENINFYNSINEFDRFASGKHSANYCVSPDDSHPGTATNKFYVDYIMNFIRKDFPHLLEKNKGYKNSQEIIINEWLPYDISLRNTSENTYSFIYPVEDEAHSIHGIAYNDGYYMTYPLGKNHIRFNFAKSVNISTVNLNGDFEGVELYYTCINKKLGYDDNSVHKFSTDDGNTFTVSPDVKITSLLISATFSTHSSRDITLKIFEDGGKK